MAHRTRPQLASAPNIAAFKRLDVITLFATVFAAASSFPWKTLHSRSFVAPSPSPAIILQRPTVIVLSACINCAKASPSCSISLFSAMPFASTVTISLVEVSPSTLTMLKVFAMSAERAFCSICGVMATSVVINTSMVAIFGWIMPLPLAMPPILQVFPPISNSTARVLGTVSVVMMPSVASSDPSVESV